MTDFPDERFPELRAKLEKGWAWLWRNCAERVADPHPECAAFERRFHDLNREYARKYRESSQERAAGPETSETTKRDAGAVQTEWL